MLTLAGVIPPLVTPLTKDEEVDASAVGSVVEHVLGGGVHGIFIPESEYSGGPASALR